VNYLEKTVTRKTVTRKGERKFSCEKGKYPERAISRKNKCEKVQNIKKWLRDKMREKVYND
jgi:hypothetical protein